MNKFIPHNLMNQLSVFSVDLSSMLKKLSFTVLLSFLFVNLAVADDLDVYDSDAGGVCTVASTEVYRFIFIVDNSGSMSSSEFTQSKNSVDAAIAKVLDGELASVKVAVMQYGTNGYSPRDHAYDITVPFTSDVTTAQTWGRNYGGNSPNPNYFQDHLPGSLAEARIDNIYASGGTLDIEDATNVQFVFFTDAWRSTHNLWGSCCSMLTVDSDDPYEGSAGLGFDEYNKLKDGTLLINSNGTPINGQFTVLNTNTRSDAQGAAAAISSPGGEWTGTIEANAGDPEGSGTAPRRFISTSFDDPDLASKLVELVTEVIEEIKESAFTQVAPAVTVNAFNRFVNREQLYFSLFEPSKSPRWFGNVKGYRITSNGIIYDQDDVNAIDPTTESIASTALSFWSDGPYPQCVDDPATTDIDEGLNGCEQTKDGSEAAVGAFSEHLTSTRKVFTQNRVTDQDGSGNYAPTDGTYFGGGVLELTSSSDVDHNLLGVDPSSEAIDFLEIEVPAVDSDGDTDITDESFRYDGPSESLLYDDTSKPALGWDSTGAESGFFSDPNGDGDTADGVDLNSSYEFSFVFSENDPSAGQDYVMFGIRSANETATSPNYRSITHGVYFRGNTNRDFQIWNRNYDGTDVGQYTEGDKFTFRVDGNTITTFQNGTQIDQRVGLLTNGGSSIPAGTDFKAVSVAYQSPSFGSPMSFGNLRLEQIGSGIGGSIESSSLSKEDVLAWLTGEDVFNENQYDNSDGANHFVADSIHARPTVITFGGTEASPDDVLFHTTNLGVLHAIDPQQGTDGGKELWSFIPPRLLDNAAQYIRADESVTDHVYGIDGEMAISVEYPSKTVRTPTQAFIYTGQRRGGRGLYAFNVTNSSDSFENRVIADEDLALDELNAANAALTAAQAAYNAALAARDAQRVIVDGGTDSGVNDTDGLEGDLNAANAVLTTANQALTDDTLAQAARDAAAALALAEQALVDAKAALDAAILADEVAIAVANAYDAQLIAANALNADIDAAPTGLNDAASKVDSSQTAVSTPFSELTTAINNSTTELNDLVNAAAPFSSSIDLTIDGNSSANTSVTDAKNTAAQETNDALQAKNDAEQAKTDAENAKAQAELDKAAAIAERTIQEARRTQADIDKGQAEIDKTNAENAKAAALADQTDANNDLTAANAALTTAESDLIAANTALTTAESDLTAANSALTTAESDLTAANSALATEEADLTAANATLATEEGDLTAANATLATEEGDLTAANTALSTAEGDLTNANSTLTSAETDLTTANTNLTTAQSDLTAANTALTTAESNLTSANSTLSTADSALTSANSTLSSAESTLTSANTALSTAEGNLTSANTTLTTAEGDLTAANATLTTANNDLAAANTALAGDPGNPTLIAAQAAAQTAADNATTAQATAQTDRDNAATAQTTAQTDRDNAATAQTTAQTDRDNAATAQTTAQTNRDSAATAQATAQTTRDNAVSTQATAVTDRDNAVTAQASAQTDRDNAVTAQATAQTDRDNAATAQATAQTDRDNAATAQATAQTDRDNAATAQATAQTDRDNAATTQATALTTRDDAVTAQAAAQTTRDNAVTTQATALTTRDNAQTAVNDTTADLATANADIATAQAAINAAQVEINAQQLILDDVNGPTGTIAVQQAIVDAANNTIAVSDGIINNSNGAGGTIALATAAFNAAEARENALLDAVNDYDAAKSALDSKETAVDSALSSIEADIDTAKASADSHKALTQSALDKANATLASAQAEQATAATDATNLATVKATSDAERANADSLKATSDADATTATEARARADQLAIELAQAYVDEAGASPGFDQTEATRIRERLEAEYGDTIPASVVPYGGALQAADQAEAAAAASKTASDAAETTAQAAEAITSAANEQAAESQAVADTRNLADIQNLVDSLVALNDAAAAAQSDLADAVTEIDNALASPNVNDKLPANDALSDANSSTDASVSLLPAADTNADQAVTDVTNAKAAADLAVNNATTPLGTNQLRADAQAAFDAAETARDTALAARNQADIDAASALVGLNGDIDAAQAVVDGAQNAFDAADAILDEKEALLVTAETAQTEAQTAADAAAQTHADAIAYASSVISGTDNRKLCGTYGDGTPFDPVCLLFDPVVGGETDGFSSLGQVWAKPVIATALDCDTGCVDRKVIVVPGGYDTDYDTAADPFANSIAGTVNGRHLYMIDAETGKIVWSAGAVDPNVDNDTFLHCDGNILTSCANEMEHSFVSEPFVLDLTGDGKTDAIFAVDIMGNVWRFDFRANADGDRDYKNSTGGIIARLNDDAGTNNTLYFYNPVDVAFVRSTDGDLRINVSVASGKRPDPLSQESEANEIFLVHDSNIGLPPRLSTTSSAEDSYKYIGSFGGVRSVIGYDNLSVLTLNNLASDATAIADPQGFRLVATPSFDGESVGVGYEKFFSRTITVDNSLIATSYVPDNALANLCGYGRNKVYVINLLTGITAQVELVQSGIAAEPIFISLIDEGDPADATDDTIKRTLCFGTECITDTADPTNPTKLVFADLKIDPNKSTNLILKSYWNESSLNDKTKAN